MHHWNKWDDDGRGPRIEKRLDVDPAVLRAMMRAPAHRADEPALSAPPGTPGAMPQKKRTFGRRFGKPPVQVAAPDPVPPAPLPAALEPVHSPDGLPPAPVPHPVRSSLRQADDPSIVDPREQAEVPEATPSRIRISLRRPRDEDLSAGPRPLWTDYVEGGA